MVNSLRKTVAVKDAELWRIVSIEGNRTPDGILQPPLILYFSDGAQAKFHKITKTGNWLYKCI